MCKSPFPFFNIQYSILFLFLPLVLIACGGGGSDSSDTLVARNSAFTTSQNTAGTGHFDVSLPSGRSATFTIVTNGTLGTAEVSDHATGEYIYTPNPDAAGSDFFTFRVSDGTTDSNLAVVSVTITADPGTPAARNDVITTDEDTSVIVNVLANDSSSNGPLDPATVSIVSQPEHGNAIANSNGSITYTPGQNYNGSDTFTYNFRDTEGYLSSTATVIVTVTAVNDAPVARNDAFTVLEDNTMSLPVLNDNGNGPDFDVDGDTITVVSAGIPDNGGTAGINSSQDRISYTPAANFFGVETFTYTISDGNGATDTATVTMTVIGVNDPPVAENDVFTVEPNTVNNTLFVLANNGNGADWDVENDALTITAVGTPSKGGSARINTNKNALIYTPAANFTGTETFTYTVSDGNGGSSTANVTVDVMLTDDFSGGIGNWTTVNDSGMTPSWTIIGNQLRQQNRVENAQAGMDWSYHKGTYAYYTSGVTLTDYRFSADAMYLGTGLADDIGVMFRYQDQNNYYRVSMNSRYGFTRFEKKVNGTFSTLATNTRGYRDGQLIEFTVNVEGSRIQIAINDEPTFSIDDASLSSGSVALYTQDKSLFDNVRVQGVATLPAVTLDKPVAGSVLVEDNLTATAVTTSVPDDGYVEFLVNGTTIVDTTAPYTALFENLPQGNHTVEAVIRDAGDIEVARDTNALVGTEGDYYVAIGDSITNGSGDNYATDNQTDRILSFQGYQANLVDLLETNQLKPITVFNEGIGGDESFDTAFVRIDSIMARHPDSNRALVLLGTNDALASIPHGSGCSGATCDGTFKGNMQALINTLSSAGKTPYVALVPPVFGGSLYNPYANPATTTINTDRVQVYNSVISSELTGHQTGPDFYDYFLGAGKNRFSLFADAWHPNALGHAVLASLWHNSVNPGNPVALPFVVDNLTRSTSSPYIKQNLLEIGDTYYVDAAYTLTSFPEALTNGRWIMTANARVERENTASDYIEFDVDRPVTVYIAYDAGATAIPNWMDTFVNTGWTVRTTNPSSPELRLYSRSYSSGTITLGGNLATGAQGADANYVTIIVSD